jgi:hypothetical protein
MHAYRTLIRKFEGKIQLKREDNIQMDHRETVCKPIHLAKNRHQSSEHGNEPSCRPKRLSASQGGLLHADVSCRRSMRVPLLKTGYRFISDINFTRLSYKVKMVYTGANYRTSVSANCWCPSTLHVNIDLHLRNSPSELRLFTSSDPILVID